MQGQKIQQTHLWLHFMSVDSYQKLLRYAPLLLERTHAVATTRHPINVVMSAVEHPVFDTSAYVWSATVCPSQANTGEVVRGTRKRRFDGNAGWSPYWDSSTKDTGTLVARKGLGSSTGTIWNYNTWGSSFLKAACVTYTKRVHEVTASALYVLQHRAYDHYCCTQVDESFQALKLGAARELNTHHSFSTYLLSWSWSCWSWSLAVPYEKSHFLSCTLMLWKNWLNYSMP